MYDPEKPDIAPRNIVQLMGGPLCGKQRCKVTEAVCGLDWTSDTHLAIIDIATISISVREGNNPICM